MKLTSTAFDFGAPIPMRFSCDGEDISPPLEISEVPAGAAALALVVDDPDAPRCTFVHWLVWNLPPDIASLPESIPGTASPKQLHGGVQGTNDFGATGWGGPCPPRGVHRYRFTIYALSRRLDLAAGSTRTHLDHAMDGAVIESCELRGTYSRRG